MCVLQTNGLPDIKEEARLSLTSDANFLFKKSDANANIRILYTAQDLGLAYDLYKLMSTNTLILLENVNIGRN